MAKSVRSVRIKLLDVRLSFPQLFHPRVYEEGQKPRFEATLLMDPTSKVHKPIIATIKSESARIQEEAFKKVKLAGRCWGYADEEGIELAGYEGAFFFKAYTRPPNKPRVVNKDPSVHLTEEDGVIYAGCYVNAWVNMYAHHHDKGGRRVNGGLLGVQFKRDGEAFSDSILTDDAWEDESEGEDDDDDMWK